MLGLNDIHSANMIHRDIKPDNIFLNGDKVKIGDFNISSEHAISKSALGTFGYMSPHMLRLNQNTASIISTG
jgi:serine/threonine protein kinase